MMRLIRKVILSLTLSFFVLFNMAFASNIKAIVNDDIITSTDLNDRVRLVMLMTGGKAAQAGMANLQNDILQALIDEKIKFQAAQRVNQSVDENEVNNAVAFIEKQNKMPAGMLGKLFAQEGVNIESFKQQIRAQLAWRNFIRVAVARKAKNSPFDVERLLQKELKEKGSVTEYLVAEIFIPVRAQSAKADARATANRIRKTASSARFGELARNFSESPSRTEDGIRGWIIKDQLPPTLDKAITGLKVGGISQAIEVPEGYFIFKLLDRRTISSSNESELEGLRERIQRELRNEQITREAALVGDRLRQRAYIEIR